MKTNDIFFWSMSGSEWFCNSITEYLGQEKAMPVSFEVIKWPQLLKIHLTYSQDGILDQWYHKKWYYCKFIYKYFTNKIGLPRLTNLVLGFASRTVLLPSRKLQ